MRIHEVITEMSNALRRQPKDPPYLNMGTGNLGNVLFVTGESDFFPKEADRSGFATNKDLQDHVDDFERRLGQKIVWVNPSYKNTAKAYGVMRVKNERGQDHYIGKYLASNKNMLDNRLKPHDPDDTDPNNFDNAALLKLGYAYGQGKFLGNRNLKSLGTAAAKAIKTGDWSAYQEFLSSASGKDRNYKLEPADVLTDMSNLTPASIVKQVADKFSDKIPSLVAVTEIIASGKRGPYTIPEGVDENPFLTQFCEILHPVAIVSGALNIGSIDFKQGKISYNSSKSAVGYDSKITLPDGKTLSISSKRNLGFSSSIDTLRPAIAMLSDEDKQKYAAEISYLSLLMDSSYKPKPGDIGPLEVGVRLGILSREDADYISKLESRYNAKDYQLRFGEPYKVPADAPENVKALIKSARPNIHGLHPFYNALYQVMKTAADRLNQDTKMRELIKTAYTTSNGVLISTISLGKDKFDFVHKKNYFSLDVGASYTPDWATKRITFKVT